MNRGTVHFFLIKASCIMLLFMISIHISGCTMNTVQTETNRIKQEELGTEAKDKKAITDETKEPEAVAEDNKVVTDTTTGTKDWSTVEITEVTAGTVEGYFTCYYGTCEREFYLFLPEELREDSDESDPEIPLLFMLHGYGDSAERFAVDTKMNEAASGHGYAVVYPQGIGDPNDQTSGAGWNSGLKKSGNDDTGFLVALAGYLQRAYSLDENRTFAAGFSNGAFMMYRLACQASDTFRAVASVAGFMTTGAWEEKPEKASIGILQINGTNDDVVPYYDNKGHKHGGNAPAIEDVIDYWKKADQLESKEESTLSEKATKYRYYSADTDVSVVYISIRDGYHSWPKEEYCGFRVEEVILDYFDSYQ